ncbi:hypothetical protein SDC9_62275 [bioreactor metagenome]|uniref:Uncharacterized protein n=1 Tax=bioreactor metagenome TaxID=1076179 RepID=A0A644XJC7_9ZZZZ
MEGQELNVLYAEFCQRLRKKSLFFRRIVVSRDDRNANDDGRLRFQRGGDVAEDERVSNAGSRVVLCGIGVLKVDIRKIDMFEHTKEGLLRHTSGGFQRDVNAFGVQRVAKRADEVRPEQRFAAGEGDAAAAGNVERFVLDELLHEFVNGIVARFFARQRFNGLGFRVGAPLAAQVAALKEHVRADARAVVNGEFLYIENRCRQHRAFPHNPALL